MTQKWVIRPRDAAAYANDRERHWFRASGFFTRGVVVDFPGGPTRGHCDFRKHVRGPGT